MLEIRRWNAAVGRVVAAYYLICCDYPNHMTV
jgi:hypothetical protein